MRWLRSVAREILDLFVNDGSFAIAIVVSLALVVVWFCRARRRRALDWAGPVRGAGGDPDRGACSTSR